MLYVTRPSEPSTKKSFFKWTYSTLSVRENQNLFLIMIISALLWVFYAFGHLMPLVHFKPCFHIKLWTLKFVLSLLQQTPTNHYLNSNSSHPLRTAPRNNCEPRRSRSYLILLETGGITTVQCVSCQSWNREWMVLSRGPRALEAPMPRRQAAPLRTTIEYFPPGAIFPLLAADGYPLLLHFFALKIPY